MTPGTYVRQCREAAGLTLDEVALRFETVPAVCARSRAEWLGSIELDDAPLAVGTALRLATIFPIDLEALVSASIAAPPTPGTRLQMVMCRAGAVTVTAPDPLVGRAA